MSYFIRISFRLSLFAMEILSYFVVGDLQPYNYLYYSFFQIISLCNTVQKLIRVKFYTNNVRYFIIMYIDIDFNAYLAASLQSLNAN